MAILYVVSTPIGNLDDITVRASKVLRAVSVVLAEDTRRTRVLLGRLGAMPQVMSFHDFNKEKAAPRVITMLKDGSDVAMVCDAGTPGIADEAFYLVREAIRNGITVVPVPGACAAIAALACGGLPTDRFVFENFLPVKSGRRRRLLEELRGEPRTVVFYESPFRIVKVLQDMKEVLGEVSVVVGRELTKVHEEFLRGTPETLLAHFGRIAPRGEMVVMFNTRVPPYGTDGKLPLSGGDESSQETSGLDLDETRESPYPDSLQAQPG